MLPRPTKTVTLDQVWLREAAERNRREFRRRVRALVIESIMFVLLMATLYGMLEMSCDAWHGYDACHMQEAEQ